MMDSSLRDELIPGFHFTVNIIQPIGMSMKKAYGSLAGDDNSFSEVSGIETTMATTEYREGGQNKFHYKLPEASKYSNLKLMRGLVNTNSSLTYWCQETLQEDWEQITKHHLVLIMLDSNGIPVKSWAFTHAYPVSWKVSGANAKNNEIMVEEIEIAYLEFKLMDT